MCFHFFRSVSSETMSSLKKGTQRCHNIRICPRKALVEAFRASPPFVTSSYKWNLGQTSRVSEIDFGIEIKEEKLF